MFTNKGYRQLQRTSHNLTFVLHLATSAAEKEWYSLWSSAKYAPWHHLDFDEYVQSCINCSEEPPGFLYVHMTVHSLSLTPLGLIPRPPSHIKENRRATLHSRSEQEIMTNFFAVGLEPDMPSSDS
jgi:hypothetical protein